MKKTIFIFSVCMGFAAMGFTQKAIRVSQSCSYDGNHQRFDEEEIYTFPNNSEAQKTVDNIIEYTGLSVNFTIEASSVPNAEAVITSDKKRVILYNEEFMRKADGFGNWAAISILAHEIGHHLNYHTLDASGSRPDLELQADIFSGFTLYKMGATLAESQAAIAAIAKEKPISNTHPPKAARLAAIANGWYKAEKQAGGNRPKPQPNKPEPKPTDQPDFVSMVYVQGGTFTMGCTSEQGDDCYDWEKPSHSVTVGNYWIGKYEVTQAEWRSIMGSNPSNFSGCDNCPVEQVSWEDIQDFLRTLNQKYPGRNYRLPTEAEWEYAARGGNKKDGTKYAGSSSMDNSGWYSANSGSKTHPVGGKSANGLGIYDMSGNVWEWCSDWYGSYSSGSQTNPTGATNGSNRVNRGGSWFYDARSSRTSYRRYYSPTNRSSLIGFRLSRTE